ncbi:hypothetical protein EVAR_75694_1 [Eumeta japonica]|uniref:Uncharacterized protein n=1 Tax=Eumeta variegata TaxID=151549 RepID=A0A4C1VZY4_EUMVA|nr:hypothetical protein EVAR_75694_1 [Eumeta japonica]
MGLRVLRKSQLLKLWKTALESTQGLLLDVRYIRNEHLQSSAWWIMSRRVTQKNTGGSPRRTLPAEGSRAVVFDGGHPPQLRTPRLRVAPFAGVSHRYCGHA